MNREHWKAILPFVEAFANGEDVEFDCGVEWRAMSKPRFDQEPARYRIAPKEKTGWINIYEDGGGGLHETRERADSGAMKGRIACIEVKYKEGDGL